MYIRAGLLSLGLLILSRLLGLLRESLQAAVFGSTGLGDAVILMFTLPDLVVGVLFSGALAYVLLPLWATQNAAERKAGEKRLARLLFGSGLLLGTAIWLSRDLVVAALAPGLVGEMRAVAAVSLFWSAAVLPLAMLAALWVTRLQRQRDFVGMYASNLVVNFLLVLALFITPMAGGLPLGVVFDLGIYLAIAMLARLLWLDWRLRPAAGVAEAAVAGPAVATTLPGAKVWLWAALSSGLLLLLPLVGRSIASQGGEGGLASFNYAWKLVELPLVLAIQLVATLAFPAIAQTPAGSAERQRAVSTAFLLAWGLACAAIAMLASFSPQVATLLFGWGRMNAEHLRVIADWSAIGVWSLLPQSLMAVLLTVMASSTRMHVAGLAYLAGLLVLLFFGWTGLAGGAQVMWLLDAVLAGVALLVLLVERRSVSGALPWRAMLVPLAACAVLTALRPWLPVLAPVPALFAGLAYATLVLGAAIVASAPLRGLLLAKIRRRQVGAKQ
jgi:putative peptidoglycan lipid II flippase